jgi:hypothetical protein
MKTEVQIIKLVAKKMADEATDMELQKLNDLFEQNPVLHKALTLLLTDKTEPYSPPDDRSRILFEKSKSGLTTTNKYR